AGGEISLSYQDYALTNPYCSYGTFTPPMGCNSYTASGCNVDTAMEGEDVNDGLCIWKVSKFNGYSTEHNHYIKYTLDSGQRFNRGGYCWYPDPDNGGRPVYTNYFVGPFSFVNGSNHGFSQITAETYGFNNQKLSKSTSNFTNLIYHDGSGWVS